MYLKMFISFKKSFKNRYEQALPLIKALAKMQKQESSPVHGARQQKHSGGQLYSSEPLTRGRVKSSLNKHQC